MTRFSTLVFSGAIAVLSGYSGASLAEEAKTQAAPQAQPAPANSAPAMLEKPDAMKSRSFRKLAPPDAAPAPAAKGGLASPDDTVGGLPGAEQTTAEKQP
jgi:hypothetical protein